MDFAPTQPKPNAMARNKPDNNESPVRPRNWFESLNCAFEGVVYAFRTQRHMRLHYLLAALALVVTFVLKLTITDFILLFFSIILLLMAEMVNTAIEEVTDLLEEKRNVRAQRAKDVGAGIVLIASVGVFMMGYVILTKYVFRGFAGDAATGEAELLPEMVYAAAGSLLLVLILVTAIKAVYKTKATAKARPLHGGMPSGHSAIAFSAWVSVTIISREPLVSLLTLLVAFMVSHSRLLTTIHTRVEVALGALLGAGVTVLIFFLAGAL